MSGILDPVTGRTKLHDQLLSLLMDWTTDESILRGMLASGLGDEAGLKFLACKVGYTLSAANGTVDPNGHLGEDEAARYVVGFLAHRGIRRLIARRTHRVYGVPYREASRSMRRLGEQLVAAIEAKDKPEVACA